MIWPRIGSLCSLYGYLLTGSVVWWGVTEGVNGGAFNYDASGGDL